MALNLRKINVIRSFFEKNLLKKPFHFKLWMIYFYFEIKNRFIIEAHSLFFRLYSVLKKKSFIRFLFLEKTINLNFFMKEIPKDWFKHTDLYIFYYFFLKNSVNHRNFDFLKFFLRKNKFQVCKMIKIMFLIKNELMNGKIENKDTLLEYIFYNHKNILTNKNLIQLKKILFYFNEKKRFLFLKKFFSINKIFLKNLNANFFQLKIFFLINIIYDFFFHPIDLTKKSFYFLKSNKIKFEKNNINKKKNIKIFKFLERNTLFRFNLFLKNYIYGICKNYVKIFLFPTLIKDFPFYITFKLLYNYSQRFVKIINFIEYFSSNKRNISFSFFNYAQKKNLKNKKIIVIIYNKVLFSKKIIYQTNLSLKFCPKFTFLKF
jgi:hypothetical protein